MLLPRRVRRRVHFVEWYFRASWVLWAGAVRRFGRGRRKRRLSVHGPLPMVVLLAAWAVGLIRTYALLLWAAEHGRPDAPGIATQLYASGVQRERGGLAVEPLGGNPVSTGAAEYEVGHPARLQAARLLPRGAGGRRRTGGLP